jgi:hypothetical protein
VIVLNESADVDYFTIFLSGDWSLPYWRCIGLTSTGVKQAVVQSRTRKIVSRFLAGENRYPGIDLSPSRRAKTRAELIEVANSVADPGLLHTVSGESDDDPKLFWFLETVTHQLVSEPGADDKRNEIRIPRELRAKLAPVCSETLLSATLPDLELEDALLVSRSAWDTTIRELFPGQPSWLTDWLLSKSYTNDSFKVFWLELLSRLSTSEIELMRQWYESRLAAIPASDLGKSLPNWMMSN